MGKTTQKRVRRKMALDLTLIAGLSGVLFWLDLYTKIPDRLTAASDDPKTEIFQNTFPDWLEEVVVADSQGKSDIPSENLTMTGTADGDMNDSGGEKVTTAGEDGYVVQCSLFGAIPVKKVEVDVVERQKIVPCGIPIGIYMKTQGVLIVGTGEVCDINGEPKNPGGDLVHSGDYILAVNDIPVSEKEEVVQQISQAVDGEVKLTVLRDSDIIELQAPVVQTGKKEYKAGEPVVLTTSVTNTGQYTGKETVQLYLQDVVSSVTRPVIELCGIRQVELAPGETRKIEFTLSEQELGFFNSDKQFVTEPGDFKLFVGSSSDNLKATEFELIKK